MGLGSSDYTLKFTGAPADIAALPQSLFLRSLSGPGPAWDHLETTYYDTPERALHFHGLSLQSQISSSGHVQRVKRSLPFGGFEESEYEKEIVEGDAFPVKTGDPEIDMLIGSAGLAPAARASFDRWTTAARFGRSDIHIAVDLGMAAAIAASGTQTEAPLAMIALQLKAGDPADLFDLGRLLAANAPVRIAGRSRLGFARMAGRSGADQVQRYQSPRASADETAAALLARSLASIAMRIARLQPAILDARNPAGVHQMRVALRRFRSMERIYRPYVKSPSLTGLAHKARSFGKILAPARDGQVFMAETMAAVLENGYAPAGVTRLRARAAAANAAAWADVTALLADPAFTQFVIDIIAMARLASWRDGGGAKLSQPAFELAPQMLDRRRRKAIRAARRIKGDDPAARHELRKQLKKLRYPAQLFRNIAPDDLRRPYMAEMAALQVAYGVFNDAAEAQHLANDAAAGGGPDAMRAAGFISGYKAAEAASAAGRIDAAWDAFEQMKPFWHK